MMNPAFFGPSRLKTVISEKTPLNIMSIILFVYQLS